MDASEHEPSPDTDPGGPDATSTLSLRERKRLTAMRRIQRVALALFDTEGFDQVTVERIAQDAEVSASSVYRWFGTKEMLVIWDEYDPAALVTFQQRLATSPPMDALREVVRWSVGAAAGDDLDQVHQRLRLAFTHPSIEAASILQAHEMGEAIAGIIARALGGEATDLETQVTTHAFVGALFGALRHYEASGFTTPLEEIVERPLRIIDAAQAVSTHGVGPPDDPS
ncbi:MAG: TetR family transcriptional regulator [Nitriliruptoraceae bacterium]|nr:TetR family transcriptional regulator [Nitriliruptoraceae bacterium]